jgi:hypothetical protein
LHVKLRQCDHCCEPALLQDYKLSDIAALRRTCQAGGGVTVSTRTVGGRDAIYKAAVDAAVRRCASNAHAPCALSASRVAVHSPVGVGGLIRYKYTYIRHDHICLFCSRPLLGTCLLFSSFALQMHSREPFFNYLMHLGQRAADLTIPLCMPTVSVLLQLH